MKLWIAAAYCYEEREVFGVFKTPKEAREVATRGAESAFKDYVAAGARAGVPCVFEVELEREYVNGLNYSTPSEWEDEA